MMNILATPTKDDTRNHEKTRYQKYNTKTNTLT